MAQSFDAGPRLSDPPSGDPGRQAVASLAGYTYQLYLSALAWLDLRPEQELYLEVAEDYATVAKGALNAVQAKHTGARSVTINSQDVLDALDSFVDLVERNRGREITLRFLSTSSMGQERKASDRAGDKPVLEYWRQAASGADLAPLRASLAAANLSQRIRNFIDARDDDTLRHELLRRIHWDCGAPGIESVAAELEARLILHTRGLPGVSAADVPRITASMLWALLNAIVTAGPRKLTNADLVRVIDEATHVVMPRAAHNQLIQAAAVQLAFISSAPTPALTAPPSVLDREAEIPLPPILAERRELITDVAKRVTTHGISFVTGGTGRGKTIVARLTARALGKEWGVIDLRNASAEETVQRLGLALGELGASHYSGIILDDLNEAGDPVARRALSRFLDALRRRDAVCLITAYREPSARTFSELALDRSAHIDLPDLTEAEVEGMLTAAGGRPQWAKIVHMAGAFGHPQLVQAVISGLKSRGWPVEELKGLRLFEKSVDVEAERFEARKQLVAAVPDETKALLYRISLLIGRFERPTVLALGKLAPDVAAPGAKLDGLIGPWVELSTQDHMRVSPLLANAGGEVLTPEEQTAVHHKVAEILTAGRSMDVSQADVMFLHALRGKCEPALMKLAAGVVMADQETRRMLADWLTGIRLHRKDRPIFPDKLRTSWLLRLAQLLLVSAKGEVDATRESWLALQAEIQEEPNKTKREDFEHSVLGKVLIGRSMGGMLPNWLDLIFRFEELADEKPGRRIFIQGGESARRRSHESNNPQSTFYLSNPGNAQCLRSQIGL